MPYAVEKQSVGFAIEPTYAATTAPTLFIPWEGISIKGRYQPVEDNSHYYGAFGPVQGQMENRTDGAGGGISGKLLTKGFSKELLELAFGTVVSTVGPAAGVPAGYVRHRFTLGSLTKSATIQKIMPREDKTTAGLTVEDSYTYSGCMVKNFGLSSAVHEFLSFTSDWEAKDETLAFAKAAPAFAALAKPFRGATGQVVVKLDGSTVCFKAWDMALDNALKIDDRDCGRDQPMQDSRRKLTITLKDGLYDRFVSDRLKSNAMVPLTIDYALIGDPNVKIAIASPTCLVTGDLPDQSATNLKIDQSVMLSPLVPATGGERITLDLTVPV